MNLATAAQSSIGRKIINGFSGLLLVGFVIGHLTGNFLLLAGPEAFNNYAHLLEHMFHGAALPLVEIGLVLVFLAHIWSGVTVWNNKAKARKHAYAVPGDAGGRSKKSVSSTSMLYTGLLLVAFVVLHVLQFKYALFHTGGRPEVMVDGVTIGNLYIVVVEAFRSPIWTVLYLVVMAALGTHLWHGAWSAFQSVGLANESYLPTIRKVAHAVAALLAIGFLALPAVIYLGNGYFQELNVQYQNQYAPQAQSLNGDTSNGPIIYTHKLGA